jgi:hypothetical protein
LTANRRRWSSSSRIRPLPQFLSEYLVLGPEVINGLLLLVVDPAGEDEMEQLPRLKNEVHGGPVAVEENGLASGLG